MSGDDLKDEGRRRHSLAGEDKCCSYDRGGECRLSERCGCPHCRPA